MKFPTMGRSRRAQVSVPELRGGVNYREAMNVLEDNQLTDVRNMWFKDGVLRTRPGLKIPQGDGISSTTYNGATIGNLCHCPASGYSFAYSLNIDNNRTVINAFDVDGYWVGIAYVDGQASLICPWNKQRAADDLIYEAICYTNAGEYAFYFDTEGALRYEQLEPYAPIVSINGKGADAVGTEAASGYMVEGYNLLTNKFRAYFNTDATSTRYTLPAPLGSQQCTITCEVGAEVWTWNTLTGSAVKEENGLTEITAKVSNDMRAIEFSAALPEVAEATGSSNNLCVIAEREGDVNKTVCHGTAYAWFGGTRSGIHGGTRLFIGGTHAEPQCMYWSDVNNPLYFSENNYVNVGAGDDPITAFGKQADLLVIFKRNEIYCTNYVEGPEYTAEDILEGRVVDITTLAATFPISQLSPKVGCDLPGTIRLMQNRLVWADSAGKVWSLIYTGEYNARNVREMGGLIEYKLAAHNLDMGTAAPYGDYYLLIVNDDTGCHVYALDTGEYGYTHYTSYGNDSRAQRKMAWYVWEMPAAAEKGKGVFAAAESTTNVVLFAATKVPDGQFGVGRTLMTYTLGAGGDETAADDGTVTETPISCMFQTKLFDMKRPERVKVFDRLFVGFGRTENLAATVTYLTEKGEFPDSYIVTSDRVESLRTAQFVENLTLTPNMRCRRLAVRVENEGEMYVDGLGLSYKL